jgi:DNA-binding Lrp family transcriptional regulator
MIVSIAASNAFDFHEIQGRLLGQIADILISSQVFIAVGFQLFRLKYLHELGTHWYEIGGKPRTIELDSIEVELLKQLSIHGRDSISDLARNLDVTVSVVATRLSRLEKEKIIVGYQAEIDFDLLGVTRFKTQLYLNDFNTKEEQLLEAYCNKHPQIIAYIRQIGECRAEIESHVSDYKQYSQLIDDLREKFPRLIRNTNSMLMHTEYLKWMVL